MIHRIIGGPDDVGTRFSFSPVIIILTTHKVHQIHITSVDDDETTLGVSFPPQQSVT